MKNKAQSAKSSRKCWKLMKCAQKMQCDKSLIGWEISAKVYREWPKAEDDESKPLNNKLEYEAVGKHNCSTSSGNAVSDNATTSNEANKSLRMKRNEEKNTLSSNGKENEEFTQENLMR